MTLSGDVARRLVFRALGELRGGTVVLRYPDGRGRRFGDGSGPTCVVDVRRPDRLWAALARRTRVGLGESYVDGDWDCDDLVALFSLLGRNLEERPASSPARALRRLQAIRPDRSERQTRGAAPGNIRAHYDLGNDLFELMLDPTMTYSCAYWERSEMTLEEAQRAKLRHVFERLRLGPEDHLLDIGCGWGGLAILAAEERGCRVTGLTLSPSQVELARARVRSAGLEGQVEILERDYRELEGSFTKISSIEMIEAIGYAEYPVFFGALDRLLARNGLVLIQAIAVPDERFDRYRRTPDWIQQYIFPGALLPSVAVLADAAARTRLMMLGLEEIGIGYAATLRAWRENIWANVDRLAPLGYDERFLRMWTYYLAFCEAGFAIRVLRDVQLLMGRATNETLPAYPSLRLSY